MKNNVLNVLVGCEFSGVVRRAFRALGHEAWSCDLLPAEDGSEFHYQTDVRNVLNHGWDLAIFHPPCTYLANSGVKWLYKGGRKENGENPRRWQQMREGALFFRELLECDIEHVAVENPIVHGYALEIIGQEQTQFIQPWQFGHGEVKATGLSLRNLPPLVPTNIVEGRHARVHLASPGPDRWKERSRTLHGIAEAMADQWGRYLSMAKAA